MTIKFSIVTPAYNADKFVRETIESVIKQKGDFEIEYLILDNLSTDKTCDIVREYQAGLAAKTIPILCRGVQIHLWSEKDGGMYEAINRGFSHATGDIYAWINADDIYLPGAFAVIARTMQKFPAIQWLKGITSYMGAQSTIFSAGHCNLYRRDWIRAGIYGPVLHFIQQDSVFWTARLWNRVGGTNAKLSVAGDYFLWKSFAEFEPLYSINSHVSCFRKTAEQKSADIQAYWREIQNNSVWDQALSLRILRYLKRLDLLPVKIRRILHDLIFGRHPYYLVKLDRYFEPEILEEDYYSLRSSISVELRVPTGGALRAPVT
jgi:glycosyltransferase involved in cell wall biosynthesis